MNLKTYYDAAVAAEAQVQAILNQMDGLLQDGKKADALALRPSLDEAKANAKEANDLYGLMRESAQSEGVVKFFVPAGSSLQEDASAKEMPRAAFDALSADKKMNFIRQGGTVV
jgi:hypothetical protein